MRPPPKGEICDAMVGSQGEGCQLVLVRCANEATETRKSPRLPFEIWLCADCAAKMDARGDTFLHPQENR